MNRLIARELGIRPDALACARAVADEPGAVFLWDATGRSRSYVACNPVAAQTGLDPEPDLGLARTDTTLARVPRWIGLLPYESRRELERPSWSRPDHRAEPHHVSPRWFRYGAVAEIGGRVRVVGDRPEAVQHLCQRLGSGAGRPGPVHVLPLPHDEPDARRAARIERALALIKEGHIYQVNLARRLDYRVEGRPVDVLARMSRYARVPFAFAAELDGAQVVSTSPELFLELDGLGRVTTRPIKGTRPRGRDAPDDAKLERALEADPKERAELSMVVDVERNDVARVCRPGSTRVPRAPWVQTFGSVHHRIAEVRGLLAPGVSRGAVLEAMLPSGSATGAPKIRAMEVIRELETERRGLYTGAFGVLCHDGTMTLAMAIRTLTVRDGQGHYFAGGGIVVDSDPAREVAETRWKAVQIARLFANDPPGD